LDKYQSALKVKNARLLASLSDSTFREIYDQQTLKAYLAKHPEDAESMAKILGEKSVATAIRAHIELASGHTVHLVLEDGEWRIQAGGIPLDRSDSPKASLDSFFRAFHDGRLDVLRRLIPQSHASRYIDDVQLEAHLNSIRGRVANAQNRISTKAKVSIRGDSAEIPYGEGWRVLFVKEENVWKIKDLE
jgi:hypothetical protein